MEQKIQPGDVITYVADGSAFIRLAEVERITVYGVVVKAADNSEASMWYNRPRWEDILTVNGEKFLGK